MSIDVNAIEQTVVVTAVGDEVNVNIIDQPVLVSVTDQIIEVEASGAAGPQGPVGAGVAAGGTTGQVLIKASNTNFDTTWTNAGAGTVYSVNASGSTGISVTGGPITGAGTLTITNTLPDQVVGLTGAGTTSVAGTYPNFTITSNDQFNGTVTSVGGIAGTGISVSGSPITTSGSLTITNTAPDQVVGLTGAGTAVITGTYPNFTITTNDQFSGTVTSVNLTAGTGISVSGGPVTSSGSINVVNTQPDQVVSLTGGGTTTISGTYPNFTITSTDANVGTVTSVNMTVPTGLTISGNPITSAGTLALALASGYSIPTTASQATWDAAYNDKINSAAVTGTTTKTLTLNQQDGGTVSASWTDDNTDAVTSVFGRTGAVVATNGDYTTSQVTEVTNLYYTDTRARASLSFIAGSGAYNSSTGAITIPTNTSQLTNGANFITLASLSATSPLIYSSGAFSITQATTSVDGFLSATDFTTFNNKQVAGNYITALTGEVTASGPGSVAATLLNSAVIGKLLTGLNLAGGGTIVSTDSILQAFGKTQNQISALVGGVNYDGVWNASTNNPAIVSSVGSKGDYYVVNVAGSTNIDGITDWKVGDWIIFNGTVWDKVDNTDAVSSVNGFTGAVSLTTANISEVTNLYYTEGRVSANTDVAANTAARHNAVTIGTANGLSLSTQALSLALATTSVTGALSSTDWTTFNNKQATLSLTTTGTSGSSTLVSNTLNVPNYTLSGLGGVPSTRSITINGTAQDLSIDRIFNVGTVTSVTATAGTGITISGSPITTSGTLTITNSAPDQVVALTASTGISVSGTYPNFTITNTSPSSGGTVTSVGLSSATSGVTIGSSPVTTSGTITLAIATASGSQNGLLSSTDWTTFNNKQNALTNPVTGTGTTNFLPKFTGASTIGNSNLVNDASGNLGLGVTPSAWYSTDGYAAIQIGNASLFGRNSVNSELYLGTNAFANSSGNPIYITSDFASRYEQNDGVHKWQTAPSGTAGNAISFTQAMTLFSTGNLAVGGTSDNGSRLNVVSSFAPIASFSGSTNGYIDISDGTVNSRIQNSGGLFIGTVNSFDLNLRTNATTRLTIQASTGAATFSSSVTATSFNGTTNNIFSVNGTEGMRLTTTGLGIGTTSPSEKLHVASGCIFIDGEGGGLIVDTGSKRVGFMKYGGHEGVISRVASQGFGIVRVGTSNIKDVTGITYDVYVGSNGNVGISTTSPGYKLDVNGTGRFTGALTGTSATFSSSVSVGEDINLTRAVSPAILSTTNQNIRFVTNGFTGSFDTAGRFTTAVGFRTDGFVQAVNLAIGASFYNSTPPTNGAIIQGNVLIGTTTDSGYKLDVSGTGLFSGNLQTNAILTIGNQFVSGNYFLQITPSTTTPISLQGILAGTGAANIVLQASGGNVGIATNAPAHPLDVNGAARASSFIPNGSSVPTIGMYSSAANTLDFATNSGNKLSIGSNGDALFSANVYAVGFIGGLETSSNIRFNQTLSTSSSGASGSFLTINVNGTLYKLNLLNS